MHPFLLAPVVLILGLPFAIGLWTTAMKLFLCLKRQGATGQSAFVTTVVIIAASVCMLTAPAWILGPMGYTLVAVVWLSYVGMGASKVWRVMQFLTRELNANPDDDVVINDKFKKNDEKKSDDEPK